MTKLRRVVGAFLALTVCVSVMICALTVTAGAAEVYVWDGSGDLSPGHTYYVMDEVKIRRPLVIPEGTKISVRSGGSLRIMASGSIDVYGELAVAIGGLIKNSGQLNVKQGGVLSVYGSAQSSLNGTMSIAGSMTVYNRGVFETSSATKIYTTADIYVKGKLYFYKSSEIKLSGRLTTNADADVEFRGNLSITLSGYAEINGHLTIGAASNVRCSGQLVLTEAATYTRFKTITITRSGQFLDNRPVYKYHDMTVDILIDEPDVIRKGIDVSWAQGDRIDWERVKASGVEFAIIRAGRGYISEAKPLAEDVCFRRNIEEAQKYGIDVGVYFYSYATTVAEARAEAQFLVKTIEGYQIQYPVILDMEENFQGEIGSKKLTNMIDAFFEEVMAAGYFPMFYSYKAWIEAYLDMTELDKYAVWLAQVSDEVTYDGGYYIWQYSFTGKVSGITDVYNDGAEHAVDLDISYKDWPSIFRKYGLNNMTP